jgi:hypothetical protein
MKAYRILVQQDPGEAPTELAAEFARDSRAREYARERLAAWPNATSIEVWSGPEKLCRFVSEARRAA